MREGADQHLSRTKGVHPDGRRAALARRIPRLRDKPLDRIIVTTLDGRLVGIAERETAERVLNEREGKEHDHDSTGRLSRECGSNR